MINQLTFDNYLSDNSPILLSVAAAHFHVSTRTIRRYIKKSTYLVRPEVYHRVLGKKSEDCFSQHGKIICFQKDPNDI